MYYTISYVEIEDEAQGFTKQFGPCTQKEFETPIQAKEWVISKGMYVEHFNCTLWDETCLDYYGTPEIVSKGNLIEMIVEWEDTEEFILNSSL